MRRLILLLLLVPASVSAQVRPGAFTTVNTTNATPTSACVGCPVGSSTPADNGGVTTAVVVLKSATPSVTTNALYNVAGALFFNGVGLAAGSSVSGTTDFVPKFTSATSLGNSIIQMGVSGLLVGIGAAPSYILDVKQTGSVPAINVTEVSGANRRATLGFGLNGAATAGWLMGESLSANATRDFYVLDATAGVTRLYIDTSGNVGLGTNTGAAKLSINGGLHVGGDTDPGDNNLLVDGTGVVTGTLGWGGGAAISSSGNVPLLNALNTFTASGTQTFTGGVNGYQLLRNINTNNTATSASAVQSIAGTTTTQMQAYSQSYTSGTFDQQSGGVLSNDGAGGLSIINNNAAGLIRFYTGGTNLRWGVNAAGDWTFGASSHLADSNGTPTYSSGFGGSLASLTGTDYAFLAQSSSSANTGGVINFGHTWSNGAICVASSDPTNAVLVNTTASTTQVQISYSSGTNRQFTVLCRGY